MPRPLSSVSRRALITSLALIAIIIGASIFTAMAHSVINHDDFTRADTPVLDLLYRHRSPLLTTIMTTVTNLLAPATFALIVTVGCVIWAWRQREFWRPFVLMGSMAAAMVASTLVKHIVERSRPPQALMMRPFELDYSFPSGHTLGIAVFVLVLGYLFYSRRFEIRHVIIWAVAGAGMIAPVALSRLYLGYHWLTDVTASAGLSLVILGIVMIIDTYMPESFTSWTPWAKKKPLQ